MREPEGAKVVIGFCAGSVIDGAMEWVLKCCGEADHCR